MSEKRVAFIAYNNTDLFNDLKEQIDFLWNDDSYKSTQSWDKVNSLQRWNEQAKTI